MDKFCKQNILAFNLCNQLQDNDKFYEFSITAIVTVAPGIILGFRLSQKIWKQMVHKFAL